jgi:hypothetical protein
VRAPEQSVEAEPKRRRHRLALHSRRWDVGDWATRSPDRVSGGARGAVRNGAPSPQCTFAEARNARDQIVGGTCDGWAALPWIDVKQYDLTTLVGVSDVQLTEAVFISDRGQIVALGALPNGDQHFFLLSPEHGKLAASASSLPHHRVSDDTANGCLEWAHSFADRATGEVPQRNRDPRCHAPLRSR